MQLLSHHQLLSISSMKNFIAISIKLAKIWHLYIEIKFYMYTCSFFSLSSGTALSSQIVFLCFFSIVCCWLTFFIFYFFLFVYLSLHSSKPYEGDCYCYFLFVCLLIYSLCVCLFEI
jgi:hypothetical protein